MHSDALDYYGRCRTANGKGVTIPSQHRYIHYFAQCMHEGSLREPREIFLTHIHIRGVPEFDPDGGCQPYIIISRATWGNGSNKVEGNEKYGLETVFDSKAALAMVHYRRQKEIEFRPAMTCGSASLSPAISSSRCDLPPSLPHLPLLLFAARKGTGWHSLMIAWRWGAAQDEALGLEGQDDVLVLAQHVLPGGRLYRAPQGRDRQVPPGAPPPVGPVRPREFLDLSWLVLRRRT